ncbi:MAG: hypothetical protein RML75_09900 [Cyanobacteriota bacterium SKYGB_h_bin112]|nr:hypothetical protein [Cyanobacteriota bacterium SKYGB_h_bin112]
MDRKYMVQGVRNWMCSRLTVGVPAAKKRSPLPDEKDDRVVQRIHGAD